MRTRNSTGIFALAGALWIGACATPPVPMSLTPAPRRLTNEATAADMEVLGDWSVRLARIVDSAVAMGARTPERRYTIAQAAEWLAFARDEYVRYPQTRVADSALAAAARVMDSIATGATAGAPVMLPGTTMVDPDVWAMVREARARGAMQLAPEALAAAEVALLRAGRVPIDEELTVCDVAPQRDRALALALHLVAITTPTQHVALLPSVPAPRPPAPLPVFMLTTSDRPLAVRDIHFALNSASLSATARRTLDETITLIDGQADLSLVLTGYTDPRGNAAYNARLSRRRAESVLAYLRERELRLAKIEVRGQGAARASAQGSSLQDLARDRRVELLFYLPGGMLVTRTESAPTDLEVERAHQPRGGSVLRRPARARTGRRRP